MALVAWPHCYFMARIARRQINIFCNGKALKKWLTHRIFYNYGVSFLGSMLPPPKYHTEATQIYMHMMIFIVYGFAFDVVCKEAPWKTLDMTFLTAVTLYQQMFRIWELPAFLVSHVLYLRLNKSFMPNVMCKCFQLPTSVCLMRRIV